MLVVLKLPEDLTPDEIERGCYSPSPDEVTTDRVSIEQPCVLHTSPRIVEMKPSRSSPYIVRTPVNIVVTCDSYDHLLFRKPDIPARLLVELADVPVRSVVTINTEGGTTSTMRTDV